MSEQHLIMEAMQKFQSRAKLFSALTQRFGSDDSAQTLAGPSSDNRNLQLLLDAEGKLVAYNNTATENAPALPTLIPATELPSRAAQVLDSTPGPLVSNEPGGKSPMSRTIVNPDETALHSAAKERFDELKINFLARHKDTVKSVLFLGMSRGAGASTAASNFARSLARDREMRVLLINADLRASELAGADTSITQNSSAPSEVAKVHVLPGMPVLADPAVLFQSKRFTAFMAQCAQQYDYVVIDGPPLDEAPESIALCTSVDGVVLVLDAQRTRRKGALRAKQRIEEVGGRILGVALNRRKFFIPQWLYRLIY